MDEVPATRRRHSPELKRRVLEACAQPGASVARVAMEHGLNTNLVHKWRRRSALAQWPVKDVQPVAEFVALPALPAAQAVPERDIRISIRRGSTMLEIERPVTAAPACAQWLRELLR